ncbi:MAG: hypothetical protein M0P71_01040 [Melioribacteraceae bacterium]|nr:hypothetical protein [Melioribacteraceae bacterium]
MFKKILKLFHKHKMVHDKEFELLGTKSCKCHCSKCGEKMFGFLMQGDFTKEWYWMYVKEEK